MFIIHIQWESRSQTSINSHRNHHKFPYKRSLMIINMLKDDFSHDSSMKCSWWCQVRRKIPFGWSETLARAWWLDVQIHNKKTIQHHPNLCTYLLGYTGYGIPSSWTMNIYEHLWMIMPCNSYPFFMVDHFGGSVGRDAVLPWRVCPWLRGLKFLPHRRWSSPAPAQKSRVWPGLECLYKLELGKA